MGKVGAPTSRYNKGPPDSKIIHCDDCGQDFRSDGVTIYEAMGRDGVEDHPF